ncbi:MAG: BlaI/MecI/CopY family transcriptional regulator [Chitinophagaceae bacterium]
MTLKPTESELEILQVLWDKKTASVREVHETLANKKEVGYTTTLKLMQIMLEKGLVKREDSSKTHYYQPAISREKTQKQQVRKLIDSLFGGSPAQLILQALGNHQASPEELDHIRQMVEDLKRNRS